MVTLKHWETAAGPSRWLQRPAAASESFESPAQAIAYWKRWSKLASTRQVRQPFPLFFCLSMCNTYPAAACAAEASHAAFAKLSSDNILDLTADFFFFFFEEHLAPSVKRQHGPNQSSPPPPYASRPRPAQTRSNYLSRSVVYIRTSTNSKVS